MRDKSELWLDELLPTHGASVRSLKIRMDEPIHPSEEQELMWPYGTARGLLGTSHWGPCAQTAEATQILVSCPNLRSLSLEGRCQQEISMPLGLVLQSSVNPHALTSFTCHDLSSDQNHRHDECNTLGWQLSQCHELRELRLFHVRDLDERWTAYAWSGSMTHLSIEDCGPQITPKIIYHLIQRLGPNLTDLVLTCGNWIVHERRTFGIEYIALEDCFDLPTLVNLTLDVSDVKKCFGLLANFRLCNSLRGLMWGYESIEELREFTSLLSGHWLDLKRLDLAPGRSGGSMDRNESNEELEVIRGICQDRGIEEIRESPPTSEVLEW